MTPKFLEAARFAVKAHHGQLRKNVDGAEIPYVTHCINVALILRNCGVEDEDTLAAALLHDTIEDTDTAWADLEPLFGRDVASIVEELSDDKNLSKPERRAAQLAHAPLLTSRAGLIKIADKTDNIESLHNSPPPWPKHIQLAYMESASRVVLAIDTRLIWRGFPEEKLKKKFFDMHEFVSNFIRALPDKS